MRNAKHIDQRRRVYFAQALTEILFHLGLAPESACRAPLSPSEWPGAWQTYAPGSGMLRPLDSDSAANWDRFRRTYTNIISASHWPSCATVKELVKRALDACVDRRRRLLPTVLALEQRLTDYLLMYRHQLARSEDPIVPCVFMERAAATLPEECRRIIDHGPEAVSLEDLLTCLSDSTRYAAERLVRCDSPDHQRVLERYLRQLAATRETAVRARNTDGRTNFNDMLAYVRHNAFANEYGLLDASFYGGHAGIEAFFSDNGFADSDNSRAVWWEDQERHQIVWLLHTRLQVDAQSHCTRILVLDSVDPNTYSTDQLRILSKDIVFLIDSHIDVAVASKSAVMAVDADSMFNYAVLTDGTIMRASEDHRKWYVAKVATSDDEYRSLLANYQAMLHEATPHALRLSSSELRTIKQWKRADWSYRIDEIVLPRLCEWMHAHSAAAPVVPG